MRVKDFISGIVSGTSQSDTIQIAKDVVASLPNECTFSVIHKYAGERFVYGYVYGAKTYGSLTIQRYQGTTVTVDLENGVYTARP